MADPSLERLGYPPARGGLHLPEAPIWFLLLQLQLRAEVLL